MSTNAVSLRRILRSIGSHTASLKQPSPANSSIRPKTLQFSTRATSQASAQVGTCNDASQPQRRSGESDQHQGIRPTAQAETDHGEAAFGPVGNNRHDRTPGSHAGVGRLHVGNSRSALGEHEKGKTAADANKAQHSSEQREEPSLPFRRKSHRKKYSDAPSPVEKTPRSAAHRQRDGSDLRLAETGELLPQYREQYSNAPMSFEDAVSSGAHRKRDGSEPLLTESGELSPQYRRALKKRRHRRMQQQARRRQLGGERHEYKEELAWQDILGLLEQESLQGAKQYVNRLESIRLPEGVTAQWTGDPRESILEIMQRTGSHVQVVPGQSPNVFSQLTLSGKPVQNAAAKRLLQDSQLIRVVSSDDIGTMESLAGLELRSEVVNRDGSPSHAPQEANPPDELDDIDKTLLSNAVTEALERPKPRAIWTLGRTRKHRMTSRDKRNEEDLYDPQTSQATQSAVSFTAHIEDLTTEQAPEPFTRSKHYFSHTKIVRDKLVTLLTSPENLHLISAQALSAAMRYLSQHMHFPAVREIFNALTDVEVYLSADAFNPLLAAAAKSENVLAFHYVVHAMRKRGVAPNIDTWRYFITLMLKRFPDEAGPVLSRMQTKAVQANLSLVINSFEEYAVVLFTSYMKAYPGASIKTYIAKMNRDLPGINWLTTFTVNKICHSLLKQGETKQAYEFLDELVRSGGLLNSQTLNTFLSAARKDENMEMAIAVLRKFHQFSHFPSPGRQHSLSVALNAIGAKQLCDIARERRYYNCYRVFWRYACCAGILSRGVIAPMREGIQQPSLSLFSQLSTRAAETSWSLVSRADLWKALAPKFAIGVRSEVEPPENSITSAAAVTANSVGPRGGTYAAEDAEKQAMYAEKQTMRSLLRADLNAARSLRPTRPLVDLAEEALLKDKNWKNNELGLPRGLMAEKYGHEMLEAMTQYGIEVQVEEGDATDAKL